MDRSAAKGVPDAAGEGLLPEPASMRAMPAPPPYFA